MILYIFGILTINSFMNSCGKKGDPEYSTSYVSNEYPNIINEYSELVNNTTGKIIFKNNKTILNNKSRSFIEWSAKIFKKNPYTQINIIGYSCEISDKNYNLNLALTRAIRVKNYLELLGIDSSRISIKAIGNKKNDNSMCINELDRHVDIILKT